MDYLNGNVVLKNVDQDSNRLDVGKVDIKIIFELRELERLYKE